MIHNRQTSRIILKKKSKFHEDSKYKYFIIYCTITIYGSSSNWWLKKGIRLYTKYQIKTLSESVRPPKFKMYNNI